MALEIEKGIPIPGDSPFPEIDTLRQGEEIDINSHKYSSYLPAKEYAESIGFIITVRTTESGWTLTRLH